jgi:adenylate kinase
VNIILFGPPGAGKGTQAKMLCQKYNLLHLSTGEILRDEIRQSSELGKSIKEIIDSGKLVSDEIIIKILNLTMENNKADDLSGYLFDGFPRNIDQANLLSDLLDSLKIKIDCILLIEVDEPILLERILLRKKSEGRSDDNKETLSSRIEIYSKDTEPLIEHYSLNHVVKRIDGIGEISEVNQRINAALEGF